MSVNGIGAGYPAWCDNADFASAGKAQRHGSGTDFAGRMADTDAVGNGSHVRNSAKAAGQTLVLDAYRASAAPGVRNVKPAYDTYESENYKIVPDNKIGCIGASCFREIPINCSLTGCRAIGRAWRK